jgi:hypothetical protein
LKLLPLLALLLAGSANAQDVKSPTAPPAGEASSRSMFYDGNRFGLQIDAGVPAGATVAFVARPWSFLRVNAGLGYDVLAFGVKGGVTLIPFHWAVTPTLGLEVGHFFSGDATRFATVNDAALKRLLGSVGYDYLSADLGLEFGSQNRFVFYVRGGITQVYPSMGNFQQALQAANPSAARITASEPALSGRYPAARLGFILYLF